MLLCCSYNPKKNTVSDHLEILRRKVDLYSAQCDNLIICDFNSDVNQFCMKASCECYNLSNLIKEPTRYKNPQNSSYIDLILTNSP